MTVQQQWYRPTAGGDQDIDGDREISELEGKVWSSSENENNKDRKYVKEMVQVKHDSG